MITYDRLYIGGEWVEPAGSDRLEVVNPATLEVIGSTPEGTAADMDRAVAAARASQESGPWAGMPAAERAEIMARLLALTNEKAGELADLITAQVGSPMVFSHFAQVGAANMVLDYFTNLTRTYEFEEVRQDMLGPAIVRREPVGVVAGIIPWNVPLFITMLKLGPTLASGSSIVLKPAPETPLDAFVLAELAHEAGVPAGVINIVPAGREVGEHLVTHPGVDKVSFTGSTAAGRRIGALCGERLKRCTLELGGKSAAIILDDADLESVVPQLLPVAVMNNGQACVAQTRILASRNRYDEVVDALTAAMSNLKVGDPTAPDTEVGPLISERQRERVEGYIATGQDEGAKITTGGGRPADAGKGWFVEPTLFSNVDNSMRIAQEEIFGPVLACIRAKDFDEALRIANDTVYGLTGSVYSRDRARLERARREFHVGNLYFNRKCTGSLVGVHPFGGFNLSGTDAKTGSPEYLLNFLQTKVVSERL